MPRVSSTHPRFSFRPSGGFPLARSTRKCELLSFQSLAHSFAQENSTTPLQSDSSALFAKNTGGGYTPFVGIQVFLSSLTTFFRCPFRCRPVGAPLFPHGKPSLSLFSPYRYKSPSFATEGGTPTPPPIQFRSETDQKLKR